MGDAERLNETEVFEELRQMAGEGFSVLGVERPERLVQCCYRQRRHTVSP